jgi:hypothetical protein
MLNSECLYDNYPDLNLTPGRNFFFLLSSVNCVMSTSNY